MNVAISRTQSLQRMDIDIELLDVNTLNPNEMSESEFNLLYANVEATGITDPLLVRSLPTGRYRVVGGHHRLEVAKLHDFTKVPCTVITDPDFDEDQEKFQVVRMNMIRGKLSPKKFLAMYESLNTKYANEVMAEAFGFSDQEQFDKLVGQMSKSLPKEMQNQFKEAAKEIKTIEGLSKLLNQMFSKYGDTLPYGYLMIDYGGKDSIWLRMSNDTKKAMLYIGKMCIEANVTVDDVVGGLLQSIANGDYAESVGKLVDAAPKVKPDSDMPTYEKGSVTTGE